MARSVSDYQAIDVSNPLFAVRNLDGIELPASLGNKPTVRQLAQQFAMIPKAARGENAPRYSEVQRTLGVLPGDTQSIYSNVTLFGDTQRVSVLVGVIDNKENKLVALTVMQSGGFDKGPTPGLVEKPGAPGNRRWSTEPVLGAIKLGWLRPGLDGRAPDRSDKSAFTRSDGKGASPGMGLTFDAAASSLDPKARKLIREHYSSHDLVAPLPGGKTARITNGCLTSSDQAMDVMNEARAYMIGAALRPNETDPAARVAAGKAAMETIRDAANRHKGNESAARAELKKTFAGTDIFATVPLIRTLINDKLLPPAAVAVLVREANESEKRAFREANANEARAAAAAAAAAHAPGGAGSGGPGKDTPSASPSQSFTDAASSATQPGASGPGFIRRAGRMIKNAFWRGMEWQGRTSLAESEMHVAQAEALRGLFHAVPAASPLSARDAPVEPPAKTAAAKTGAPVLQAAAPSALPPAERARPADMARAQALAAEALKPPRRDSARRMHQPPQ